MLYPQNGDRIVTIDSVTSLHHVYLFSVYLLLILLLHFFGDVINDVILENC